MKPKLMFLGLIVFTLAATTALAVPTRITVRVKAKDAMFIGTSKRGAQITIKDVATGELLAKGVTAGTPGNLKRMMKAPVTRGRPISSVMSAQFTATIDINEPRLIEVSAFGPMDNIKAANRASATQWIVPGKHITAGDAWMLELPGFVVEVRAPADNIQLKGVPQAVKIETNVVMM